MHKIDFLWVWIANVHLIVSIGFSHHNQLIANIISGNDCQIREIITIKAEEM